MRPSSSIAGASISGQAGGPARRLGDENFCGLSDLVRIGREPRWRMVAAMSDVLLILLVLLAGAQAIDLESDRQPAHCGCSGLGWERDVEEL